MSFVVVVIFFTHLSTGIGSFWLFGWRDGDFFRFFGDVWDDWILKGIVVFGDFCGCV